MRSVVATAALLLSLAARADDPPPSELYQALVRINSEDALDRMRGAVEARIGVGYGSFTTSSSGAFYSVPAGTVTTPQFGGGVGFGLSLAYRWRRFGFGLEGSSYSLGNNISYMIPQSPTIADAFAANEYSVFQSVYLTPPESHLHISVDLREGWGFFTDNQVYVSFAQGSASLNGGVLGGRLNAGYRLFPALPDLQLGGFLSLSVWFPVQACSSGNGPSQCGGENNFAPNVAFQAGFAATYTLPVKGPPALEYVLVASRAEAARESTPAAVSASQAYRDRHRSIHQVALSAPAACENTALLPPDAQALIRTHCRLEMAELERDLLKQGFTVTSANAVSTLVHREQLTPAEAAARLGAQVLFQVNALERVRQEREQRAASDYRFFSSDTFGSQGAPVDLGERDRTSVRLALNGSLLDTRASGQVGASLDVTAVLLPTGEPFWTYRRQQMDPRSIFDGVSVLVHRDGDASWARAEPAWSHEDASEAGELVAATEQATYYRLLHQVVLDCVHQFAVPTN